MSKDPLDVLPHIIEIKERLAGIEAHAQETKSDLKQFAKEMRYMSEDIDEIQSDSDKMEGSLKLLKWIAPTGPVVIFIIIKLADYL